MLPESNPSREESPFDEAYVKGGIHLVFDRQERTRIGTDLEVHRLLFDFEFSDEETGEIVFTGDLAEGVEEDFANELSRLADEISDLSVSTRSKLRRCATTIRAMSDDATA